MVIELWSYRIIKLIGLVGLVGFYGAYKVYSGCRVVEVYSYAFVCYMYRLTV